MKKHLTIRLDEKKIMELKLYCVRNNTTITEVITRQINNIIDEWVKPIKLQNGWAESYETIRFLTDEDVYYEGQEIKLKESGETLFIMPKKVV